MYLYILHLAWISRLNYISNSDSKKLRYITIQQMNEIQISEQQTIEWERVCDARTDYNRFQFFIIDHR